MNKIEKAIADCQLKIEGLTTERIIILAQLNILQDQLENLKSIEKNKAIPHHELFDKPVKVDKQ